MKGPLRGLVGLENQTDVRVSDKAPGPSSTNASPVRPTRISEITSQMNLRLTSATATPTAERLPATATVMKGSEPSWNVTGPNQTRSERAPITAGLADRSVAAVDPVQADARNEQPFPAGGIDQSEADNGRRLTQQAQGVEPAALAGFSDQGNCTVQPSCSRIPSMKSWIFTAASRASASSMSFRLARWSR